MNGDTMLYHSIEAPEGKLFNSAEESFESLAKVGWVDNPAKIGVNVWGDDAAGNVIKILHEKYLSGEVPGIEKEDDMSKSVFCAIWTSTEASDKSERKIDDGIWLDSLRAGGKYSITENAISALASYDARCKARLTSWLVKQRRLGVERPKVTTTKIKDTERGRDMTVHKRADRLLQYIGDQTPEIGSVVACSAPYITCPAIAWSESTSMSEVNFLLDYLEKQDWLEGSELSSDRYTLTVEGYARLAELERADTQSSQAFVAMWFHTSTTDAWEQGIKLGIEDAGYEPFRIDRKEHVKKIDDEVIAEIRRSRFVVADFTQGEDGVRGSVYYEAGFAHGLDIPVIFVCRKDVLNELHFDTRQYNHIAWETPEELRKRLAVRISAVIGDGPNK